MNWIDFPAGFLDPVDDTAVIEYRSVKPKLFLRKRPTSKRGLRGILFKRPDTPKGMFHTWDITYKAASPKSTEDGRISLAWRPPIFAQQSQTGYPCVVDHLSVYSRAFWLSRGLASTDEINDVPIVAVGFKIQRKIESKSSSGLTLFRQQEDATWTRTTSQHRAVKAALIRLRMVQLELLQLSELYTYTGPIRTGLTYSSSQRRTDSLGRVIKPPPKPMVYPTTAPVLAPTNAPTVQAGPSSFYTQNSLPF